MKLKNIFLSLAAGSLMAFSSCTNLDETIYDQLTDDVIDVTDEQTVGAVMGEAYAQLRYLYWGWNGYFDLMEECADTYVTPKRLGVGWGDLYIPMHKHSWNSEQGHLWGAWYYAYVGIGYCNQCLDVLPETGQIQAEMRFLRSIFYYILLDAFRNVPLETTMDVPAGYLPVQSDAQTIFDFIEDEIAAIKNELSTEYVHGYPNRYAASMLMAKMYLNYNAWFRKDDDSYYTKALNEVEEVINSGKFELAENYLDCFKANISSCPEVIFAIPENATKAAHNYLVNKALVGAGAAAYGYNGTPWNGSAAVPQFIDSYDSNDQRLKDTWAGGVQYYAVKNSDGTYTPQAGDAIPFTDDDWSGTGKLNYSKALHSVDNPGAYQQEGYRFVKSEIVGGTDGTYGNDVAFFRYADALFIKAECLLRLGQQEDVAAQLVTEVRKRSFPNLTSATRTAAQLKGGSVYAYGHEECTSEGYANWETWIRTSEGGADIILGGLLDDLAWEFVGEHHRRQDLIRFKMTDGRNVFNGKSWFCKDATTETHWDYYPIPKDFMDSNINLKQNDGYQ